MRRRLSPAVLLALALAAGGCGDAREEGELLVFAASSLAGVLPELGEDYARRTGTPVRFSFGSSMTLARQVAAGAPADLLISADHAVHPVIADGMIYEAAYLGLACNGVVMVLPREAVPPAAGLAGLERIAVGDWRAGVPVGLRAEEWLRAEGAWEDSVDRLLPCADARATLAAVASGAADAGIVYATDAAGSAAVEAVAQLSSPPPAVHYSGYELTGEGRSTHDFLGFLSSPVSQDLWRAHGFDPWIHERAYWSAEPVR